MSRMPILRAVFLGTILLCALCVKRAKAQESQSSRVIDALSVLDNPNWHENDPWIRKYGEEDREPNKAAPERTQNAISLREFTAMQVVIEGYTPSSALSQVLSKYVDHRNLSVAGMAASELIRRESWSLDRAVEFASSKSDIGLWATVLDSMPPSAQLADRLRVARAAMRFRFENSSQQDSAGLAIFEVSAARTLVQSRDSSDRDFLVRAAEAHPDEALLWLSVSRYTNTVETKAAAARVAADPSKPNPVRLGAALVENGREHQDTIRSAMEKIHTYLQEFGASEFEAWLREGRGRTASDPVVSEKVKKWSDGMSYFAILRELPSETIRAEMPRLAEEGRSMWNILLPILGRRTPDTVLDWISSTSTRTPEIHRAAFLIAQLKPELAERSRQLVPQADWSRLEDELRQDGLGAVAGFAATLTLWEE